MKYIVIRSTASYYYISDRLNLDQNLVGSFNIVSSAKKAIKADIKARTAEVINFLDCFDNLTVKEKEKVLKAAIKDYSSNVRTFEYNLKQLTPGSSAMSVDHNYAMSYGGYAYKSNTHYVLTRIN